MSDYFYEEDGKLHTRYSELAKCTSGAMENVIAERTGRRERVETEAMAFGTDRHELWAEEGASELLTPACFGERYPITSVEQEFATEILPGVVLHSRMDAFGKEVVYDYKTMCAEDLYMGRLKAVQTYAKSKQLLVYALQLGHHGIRIKKGMFLVEIWNMDRTEILGYARIVVPISLADIAKVQPWIEKRAALLAAAIDQYNKMMEVFV